MAHLIASSNGNLNAASWAPVSAAAVLDSESGSTLLTTTNQNSASFVLEANQIDGMAFKVNRRDASPSGTVTITLRNSTTGTDIWSVTLNQSDIDQCSGANAEGGWYLITAAAHTPNGTDSYILQAKVSANTTNLTLWTNGTAANWVRLIRRTSTATPAAADNMHIMAEWTAAATKTNRTITMDQTATTAYGAGVTGATGLQTPGFTIDKGGTLTYGSTASTNYVLRMNGSMVVYSGGTLNIGTVATPIPRTSTAVLEFSCAADDNFGLVLRNNHTCTIQGLSRTSGKNVVWTLLTADLSASGTSSTVADDTGWLNGDVIAIALTSLTQTDSEQLTLSADATSTTLAHGAAAVAHKGTAATLTQAEVILLTRNVKVRATNSSFGFRFEVGTTGTCDIDWCEFQYGSNSSGSCISVKTITGTVTVSFCSFRDMRGGCWQQANALDVGGTMVLEHSVMFNTSNLYAVYCPTANSTGGTFTLNDLVIVKTNNSVFGIYYSDAFNGSLTIYPTITNIRVAGTVTADGIQFNWGNRDWSGSTGIGPFVIHGCGHGVSFPTGITQNLTIIGVTAWRNSANGLNFPQSMIVGLEITTALLYGNGTGGLVIGTPSGCVFQGVIRNLRAFGDSTKDQPSGIKVANQAGSILELRVEKADLGSASGVWIAHTTGDIAFACVRMLVRMTFIDTKLSSTTPVAAFTYAGGVVAYGSFIRFQRYQQTAASHKTLMLEGTLAYETTTVDVSPSLKMTPLVAARKLKSNIGQPGNGFLVPVLSGTTPTVSLKVRKDGTYNGNAPRLVLAQNSALGQDSDSVLATLSVGANTWETLSSALPSATDDGVWEVYVDCDGTAGNVFVDTGTVT